MLKRLVADRQHVMSCRGVEEVDDKPENVRTWRAWNSSVNQRIIMLFTLTESYQHTGRR